MFTASDPCLPTPAKPAPGGPQWVHEIKHDGYRLMIRRYTGCPNAGAKTVLRPTSS
jgi:ATP-dependent DNA ligase